MRTAADKIVDNVGALSPILAGLLQALVDVLLAEAAPVAGQAFAAEAVDFIDASALIQAGVGGAFVDVHLALRPICPGLAVALKKKKKKLQLIQGSGLQKLKKICYKFRQCLKVALNSDNLHLCLSFVILTTFRKEEFLRM
jgi:hypothetical protein